MSFADARTFLGGFLRHPQAVSSVIPTSRQSARSIARCIEGNEPCTVVEYGPGTGSVSAAVLERLAPGSRLILIEKTMEFIPGLRARFAHDDRVTVVHGDAGDVEAIVEAARAGRPRYILCSIPLSLMTPTVRQSILGATARLLGAEGRFIVFLFRPKATASYLRESFVVDRTRALLWNIPPLHYFEARVR